MNTINVKNLILGLATACYVVVCGAGSYEHAVIVPAWTANPPASITMFHGPYALDLGRWWLKIHPVNLMLLITALWLLRDAPRFITPPEERRGPWGSSGQDLQRDPSAHERTR